MEIVALHPVDYWYALGQSDSLCFGGFLHERENLMESLHAVVSQVERLDALKGLMYQ